MSQVPLNHRLEQMNTAAKFFNRVAGISATVGIGSFCLQECIYDGASLSCAHAAVSFVSLSCLVRSMCEVEVAREFERLVDLRLVDMLCLL